MSGIESQEQHPGAADREPARHRPIRGWWGPNAPWQRLRTGGRRLQTSLAKAAFPLMGLVCAVGFYILYQGAEPDEPVLAAPDGEFWVSLTVFSVLAGFPSWLYLRFLSIKMGPIYQDYVLNLHRLGVDDPAYLPRPLKNSRYYKDWKEGRAAAARDSGHPDVGRPDTIYDRKFEAYFGRREGEQFTGMGSLLPVIAAWVAFAVGWVTIVLNTEFVQGGFTYEDALRFGFMGAYLFSLQLTVRSFFQGDLRSGTYVGIVQRLVVVAILVTVIHVAWSALFAGSAGNGSAGTSAAAEAVVVFVVGSFPLVGQEWLNQWSAAWMRKRVRSLDSRHPLSDIDGMNVWYEARLLEEGIEDVQNLATANVVDVVLHSRAPVGRLVDWIDQALLRQHLPPNDEETKCTGWKQRARELDEKLLVGLNALGVRTATDLLELCSPLSQESQSAIRHGLEPLEPAQSCPPPFHERMLDALPDQADREVVGVRILAILRCLGNEPNLQLVLNWQTGQSPSRAGAGDSGGRSGGGGAPLPAHDR